MEQLPASLKRNGAALMIFFDELDCAAINVLVPYLITCLSLL